jgi:hypothetical protein
MRVRHTFKTTEMAAASETTPTDIDVKERMPTEAEDWDRVKSLFESTCESLGIKPSADGTAQAFYAAYWNCAPITPPPPAAAARVAVVVTATAQLTPPPHTPSPPAPPPTRVAPRAPLRGAGARARQVHQDIEDAAAAAEMAVSSATVAVTATTAVAP